MTFALFSDPKNRRKLRNLQAKAKQDSYNLSHADMIITDESKQEAKEYFDNLNKKILENITYTIDNTFEVMHDEQEQAVSQDEPFYKHTWFRVAAGFLIIMSLTKKIHKS